MQLDIVPRLGQGRANLDAALRSDSDVHERVESGADVRGFDAVGSERLAQIFKATWVVTVDVGVKQVEGFLTARREQKIVASHHVPADPQHRLRPVAIKQVT